MVDHDQVRPLAPSSDRLSSDGDAAALHLKKLRRRRCIRCCGCVAVTLIVLAAVIVALVFTIFRVKGPVIQLNAVTVTHLDLINKTTPRPGSNMSLIADVSVKNQNYASFKYSNTTTTLYYYGKLVGEAQGPPGEAKARRTSRMNVTVDIMTTQLLSSPYLSADIASRVLTVATYSVVPGRVKILIIKKHLTVKMNCTLGINMTNQAIQTQNCKQKVDL